jgi:hypothetical protein
MAVTLAPWWVAKSANLNSASRSVGGGHHASWHRVQAGGPSLR